MYLYLIIMLVFMYLKNILLFCVNSINVSNLEIEIMYFNEDCLFKIK